MESIKGLEKVAEILNKNKVKDEDVESIFKIFKIYQTMSPNVKVAVQEFFLDRALYNLRKDNKLIVSKEKD